MNRDELADLFYGRQSSPPPWTTDCPIRFDVWWRFAQPSPHGLDRRVDLILTIHEDHGVADVLRQLQVSNLPRARPAAVGGFVVVSLSLPDLMRAVVPITNLEGIVRTARRAGPTSLAERVDGLTEAGMSTQLPGRRAAERDVDEPERSLERDEQLDWLLSLLHGVIRSCTGDGVDTAAATVDLLLSAPVERERRPNRTGRAAAVAERRRRYPVDSVTINRATSAAVFQSRATVKADAAEQVFSIDCATIGWAVVDSGIDAAHPAFFDWDTSSNPDGEPVGLRVRRAFDFHDARRVLADRSPSSSPGLVDWRQVLPFVEMSLEGPQESLMDFRGVSDADLSEDRHAHRPTTAYRPPAGRHGTHVAGVLGGHWPVEGLRGICPNIRLYDFRVLDGQGHGDEFSVLAAMQAIRYINEQAGRLVIASVNLSLSVPHDVAAHACGWTPVCQEAERLVRSGVVVVAAAGNAGFGEITRTTGDGYRPTSVSDPGNADAVITVGSTHRNNPHRHGISYFSGRGPTADGRAKPDLIAPGEDIDGPVPGGEIMAMHGTSQAAAHVSGAAAMLMARHRELIGRPERIKQILCATATDLGRERAFQGHGLVDVLRAIQSL